MGPGNRKLRSRVGNTPKRSEREKDRLSGSPVEQLMISDMFAKAFAINPAALALTKLKDGLIMEMNEACQVMFEYSREEMIGHSTLSLSIWPSPEDRAHLIEELQEKGGFRSREVTLLKRSGQPFVVMMAAERMIAESEELIVWSFLDITDRKRAEETLAEAHRKLMATVEVIPDLMFEVDAMGRIHDYHANKGDILYVPPEVFLGKTVEEVLPPEAAGIILHALAEATAKGRHRGASYSLDLPNGRRWFELSIAVKSAEAAQDIRHVVLARDITGHIQAQDALAQSERNYREIFDNVSDAVFIHDAGTGAILDVNNSMLQMYGVDRATALSLSPDDASLGVSPYSEREARRWLLKALAEGPQVFEWQARKKDGELFWMEISLKSAEISGQRRILALARDITDRKLLEAEQDKLRAQLLQAQKMESVGRLAGGVAHDFNNMLGVILGHTELALEQVGPAQPLYADLMDIQKAAQHSAELTRQLLAFARKQTVSPKVLDINETIDSALSMLRRIIGENIALSWLPDTEVWPIEMDPSQINQILANLCVNARDAITDIGKIIIKTDNSVHVEKYSTHQSYASGEYVRLTVSDNGCGMDKEILSHIFEPFFTTKGIGEGTGLGLSTVYGVVVQNAGFISVDSKPGQGTVFEICLPRYAGKAPKIHADAALAPAMAGPETILLVEDEPSILTIATRMLRRLGHTVLPAATSNEAMSLAREHAGEIRILMTDVVMPDMNGRELAQKLLSLYPHFKCIFVSGYTADVITRGGVLEPETYFLQKPFSLKELTAILQRVKQGI